MIAGQRCPSAPPQISHGRVRRSVATAGGSRSRMATHERPRSTHRIHGKPTPPPYLLVLSESLITRFMHPKPTGRSDNSGGGGETQHVEGGEGSVDSVTHPGWGGRVENRPFNHLPGIPGRTFFSYGSVAAHRRSRDGSPRRPGRHRAMRLHKRLGSHIKKGRPGRSASCAVWPRYARVGRGSVSRTGARPPL